MGPFQKFHADSADPPSESTVSPLEAGIDPHGVNRKVVIGIVAGVDRLHPAGNTNCGNHRESPDSIQIS